MFYKKIPTIDDVQKSLMHASFINNRVEAYYDIVKNAIDLGLDVNSLSKKGQTILMMTEVLANKKIAELILKVKNVNLDVLGKEGTALHYAAIFDQGEALQLYIDHGANLETLNNQGRTALESAFYATVRIVLVRAGANLVYPFSSYRENFYKEFELKSTIIGRKIFYRLELTDLELSFMESPNYMIKYEEEYIAIDKKTCDVLGAIFTSLPADIMTDISNFLTIQDHRILYKTEFKKVNDMIELELEKPVALLEKPKIEGMFFYTGCAVGILLNPLLNSFHDYLIGENKDKSYVDYYADLLNIDNLSNIIISSLSSVALSYVIPGVGMRNHYDVSSLSFEYGILCATAVNIMDISYDLLWLGYNQLIGESSNTNSHS